MNLKELNSFKLSDAVTFHDKLNPKLWNGTKLRPDVREQLMLIAQDFLEELGVHDLDVKDITISGSNAAYSYTKHSDLDLHILVDMGNLPVDEVYKELFTAKKTIYNDTHDIKIHTIPVELYVQDSRQPVVSLGEYSVMNDQWIRIPTKRRSDFDQTTTKSKYEKLLSLIEIALKSKKYSKVKHIIDTIKRYRQAGLDKGGEFGPENLAYKMLRSQGYITKLYDLRDKLHSEKLSFETMYRNVTDEDYDPNGPPPGPEFKPTMPAGTVKVDVSDVYDWYKLGQHISNLKGLGKHDFGQGPPSTIMAFGDEDIEHKYINALKKTGLTTTDIDPLDPKQPKGMPRQKVDPTYNVNEEEEEKNHWYDAGVKDATRGARPNPRTYLPTLKDKQAKHPEEVYFYMNGYKSVKQGVAEEYNTMQFASEKTPPVSPYAGIKDNQYRGSISEVVDNDFLHSIEAGSDQTVEMNGYSFRVKNSTNLAGRQHRPGIVVNVYDNKNLIGWADFILYQDKKDAWLESHDTEVVEKYQNKGIATMMYAVVKSLGFDIKPSRDQSTAGKNMWRKWGKDADHLVSEASGYIPSEKEKNDPRFKTALTVDINPYTMKKGAKQFNWDISRAGIPPTAKTNGKI